MTPKTFTILGCGWLGLPLGRHLAGRGHRVKGTTTRAVRIETLAEAGIEPFLLTMDPGFEGVPPADVFAADALFFNVPPPRRRPDVAAYVAAQIEALLDAVHAAPVDFIVFASSTSVYADVNRTVTEDAAGTPPPASASGRALLAAERRLLADEAVAATVLRFAGLYGYDRQPGRFLAGRTDLPGGEAPVNLVHRDDGVAVAARLLEDEVRGEVFNVCADAHPTRRAFYAAAARRLGLQPPTFADGEADAFKVVDNRKLKQRLGYAFLHPDPSAPTP